MGARLAEEVAAAAAVAAAALFSAFCFAFDFLGFDSGFAGALVVFAVVVFFELAAGGFLVRVVLGLGSGVVVATTPEELVFFVSAGAS